MPSRRRQIDYELFHRRQLDAAILRASFRGIVAGHEVSLPVAMRNQMACRDTMLFEIARNSHVDFFGTGSV
jgi:hypothetical protein